MNTLSHRPAAQIKLAQIRRLLLDEANPAGLTTREGYLLYLAIEDRIFTEISLSKNSGVLPHCIAASLGNACKKLAKELGVLEALESWIEARNESDGGFYLNLLFVTMRDSNGAACDPAAGYANRLFTLHPDLAAELISGV